MQQERLGNSSTNIVIKYNKNSNSKKEDEIREKNKKKIRNSNEAQKDTYAVRKVQK